MNKIKDKINLVEMKCDRLINIFCKYKNRKL